MALVFELRIDLHKLVVENLMGCTFGEEISFVGLLQYAFSEFHIDKF